MTSAPETSMVDFESLDGRTGKVASFLKAFGHPTRLMILCRLADGERSVTELEGALSRPQSYVSQQLARLRLEGLVVARRDGKEVHYRLADDRSARMVGLLVELFCRDAGR